MNYPSDFPSCSQLNYSVSSRLFFFFCCEMKASRLSIHKPAAVCPSVSNCLSSVCLWLSVCQLSGPANRQMMHWGDGEGAHTWGNWFVVVLCRLLGFLRDVSYYARKKRTASTNGEKDAIHGCSTTQLPQSARTGIAVGKSNKRTDAHTRHTHKHGASKWMPLVREYPIA